MNGSNEGSPARDAGLFLTLAILFNRLLYPGNFSAAGLAGTFYLAFFAHAGFTLYEGRFGRLRTKTWLLLAGLWALAQISPFFGYVLVLGQLNFWFVTVLVNLGLVSLDPGEPGILPLLHAISGLWPGALPLAALSADIAVLYYERWRRSAMWKAAVFAACAFGGGIVLGVALGYLAPPPAPPAPVVDDLLQPPPHIAPAWCVLPEYAMLRAFADKLAGVLAVFGAALVPLMGPWMRADVLRTGLLGWLWAALCVLLAAAWFGLGYLGSLPALAWTNHAAQALTGYYFAFFLVLPPLLRRASREMGWQQG